MSPAYDWGSDKLKVEFPDTWMDERKKRGVMGDCSLLVWRICFRCDKWYSRVTSKDMSAGKGGWKGKHVKYEFAPACTVAFMTFSDDREDGHTGFLLEATKKMKNRLAHASQKFNKFMESKIEEDLKNTYYMHLSNLVELD